MSAEDFFKKLTIIHYISVGIGLLVMLLGFSAFSKTKYLLPIIVSAVTIAWLPFWVQYFVAKRRQSEIEQMFPDFVSDLVNSVKSGVPVSQSIVQISGRDYGSLTPHIKKLAAQIQWSVPLHRALEIFADRTKNSLIRRSISTVIEAEKSGGNIEDVLHGITKSLVDINEIRDKRKALIHSQLVQAYIIFAVFLIVMVFIQNSLIPYLSRIQGGALGSIFGTATAAQTVSSMTEHIDISFASGSAFFSSLQSYLVHLEGIFTMLAVIQGLFAGLVLGKLSEGEIMPGLKHSLILMTCAIIAMNVF
jgi:flagellar protein FlaJ